MHSISGDNLGPIKDLSQVDKKEIQKIPNKIIKTLSEETIQKFGNNIAHLTQKQMRAFTAQQLSALTIPQVAALSGEQIPLLPIEVIQKLSPAAIQALKDKVYYFTPKQIKHLSTEQLQALTQDQVGALSDEQSHHLPDRVIETFSKEQISNLNYIGSLRPKQMKYFSKEKFEILTREQREHLSEQQVRHLPEEVIENLTFEQFFDLRGHMAHLTSAQMKKFPMEMLKSASENQLTQLSPSIFRLPKVVKMSRQAGYENIKKRVEDVVQGDKKTEETYRTAMDKQVYICKRIGILFTQECNRKKDLAHQKAGKGKGIRICSIITGTVLITPIVHDIIYFLGKQVGLWGKKAPTLEGRVSLLS